MYLKLWAFKKYVAEIELPGNSSSFIYNCYAAAGPIWSRIHEQTISLRFLGIILRLEVSVYKVYITNQFQTTSAEGGGGRHKKGDREKQGGKL